MSKTDILVIGAGSSGAYFAKVMAEKGYAVTVIEKLSKDDVGTKYDVFHIEEKEFSNFDIPRPVEGDPAWAFEFSKNLTADPMNLYPKEACDPIVGLHMHAYTVQLNEWAQSYGAEIIYEASFQDFLFTDGKISGAVYRKDGKTVKMRASVVVDCSGFGAAGRCRLPKGYGIETFRLGGDDMFYVVLRYVKLKRPEDYLDGSRGWPFFKSWIAPSADPEGAIVGIGACHSYEHAEEVFSEMLRHIELPEHTLERIERGVTPYTRPPYSFVADNFVVSGDAACLTKAINGEGVPSSMVHLAIVADVLDQALKNGDTSKEALWSVNTRYNEAQGADFSSTRALLTGVVNAASFDEFEYAFESGMITDELMNAGSAGPEIKVGASIVLPIVTGLLRGVLSGRVSRATLRAAARALGNADKIKRLYLAFPDNPTQYARWCVQADRLWKEIGKIK